MFGFENLHDNAFTHSICISEKETHSTPSQKSNHVTSSKQSIHHTSLQQSTQRKNNTLSICYRQQPFDQGKKNTFFTFQNPILNIVNVMQIYEVENTDCFKILRIYRKKRMTVLHIKDLRPYTTVTANMKVDIQTNEMFFSKSSSNSISTRFMTQNEFDYYTYLQESKGNTVSCCNGTIYGASQCSGAEWKHKYIVHGTLDLDDIISLVNDDNDFVSPKYNKKRSVKATEIDTTTRSKRRRKLIE